jgi:hypothetical protein
VIDYDVGNAFIPSTDVEPIINDSGFVFSPTLRAADATRTGSVSGVVRAHDASGAPVRDASLRLYLANLSQPENTWPTMGHARTDANGAFKFSYVTPSDHWTATAYAGSAYVVAIDPPPGAGLTRVITPSVVVSARLDATVGTVALP